MKAADLIQDLFGEDIYAGFDKSAHELDLQGWGRHDFLFKVAETLAPRVIVEVGVWKGRSALGLATMRKRIDADFTLICVDTWLGSQEHFEKTFRHGLQRAHGYPHLYEQFLANVLHRGHQDVIVPLPIASLSAAQLLKVRGLKPDLIHIDGGHGYLEVKADIESYWPLLAPDGVMILDDYGVWQGVTRAVNEFAAERALPLIATHGEALLSPSTNYRFNTTLARIDAGAWTPQPG